MTDKIYVLMENGVPVNYTWDDQEADQWVHGERATDDKSERSYHAIHRL